MKELYELELISRPQRDMIRNMLPQEEPSPLKRLYEYICNHPGKTDADAMFFIYGKRKPSAYSRLKSRLTEILYYVISYQDNLESSAHNPNKIVIRTYHEFYTAKALMRVKANDLLADFLDKSIEKFAQSEQTEQALFLLGVAIPFYGSTSYNRYKYHKYLDLEERYIKAYELERRTSNFYTELERIQIRSVTKPDDAQLQRVKNFIDRYDRPENYLTIGVRYNMYRIKAFYFEYQKDYVSLFDISVEILNQIKSLERKRPQTVGNITVRLIWVMIQLNKLSEAVTLGKEEMDTHPEGHPSWYRLGYYVIKSYLYDRRYEDALLLASKMINHPRFARISDFYQELYITLLGYLHLLADFNLVVPDYSHEENALPEFKLGKFLNTTPVFSKDKRGINISIILLHIAWLLKRKDYSAIIDRTDSLNQYAYRYLRRDDTFRSNCMIKMVIQMTKADFNPIRTERYTADLRKQLGTVPLMGSGENIEIEMIPFEVLWDIMMKSLQPAA